MEGRKKTVSRCDLRTVGVRQERCYKLLKGLDCLSVQCLPQWDPVLCTEPLAASIVQPMQRAAQERLFYKAE